MKFHVEHPFLSKGSTQISTGDYVAVGIAESSEVDLCDVGPYRLGTGGIVPFAPGITAVRSPYKNVAEGSTGQFAPVDGSTKPGERLVLQLYEPCDALVPPGPRSPYVTSAILASALPTTITTAQLMMRLPFSNRRQATFFLQGNASNVFIIFRGVRYGLAVNVPPLALGLGSIFDEVAQDDWFAGAAAAPVSQVSAGLQLGRTFHVGGGSDNQESYDELQVFCYSPGANLPTQLLAEVFGERNR